MIKCHIEHIKGVDWATGAYSDEQKLMFTVWLAEYLNTFHWHVYLKAWFLKTEDEFLAAMSDYSERIALGWGLPRMIYSVHNAEFNLFELRLMLHARRTGTHEAITPKIACDLFPQSISSRPEPFPYKRAHTAWVVEDFGIKHDNLYQSGFLIADGVSAALDRYAKPSA